MQYHRHLFRCKKSCFHQSSFSNLHLNVVTGSKLNPTDIFYSIRNKGKSKHNLFACSEFNSLSNRPFPSSPGPLYQNKVKCSAFDMEMIFHSHASKTHFHKKGCALGLILKVRVLGTRKWSIRHFGNEKGTGPS